MRALHASRVVVAVAMLSMYAGLASVAASPIRQLTSTAQASLRPALSPDTKRVAFQRNEGDGRYRVWVMDADGGNTKRLTSGDADDRHPAWSPDGTTLAVDSGTEGQREIWLIDVASTQRTQVTKLGGIASFPSWSPDGSRLAFYVYRAGVADLWMVRRDGSSAQQLTETLASEERQQCTFACHAAAWSPRGDQIAFSSGTQSRVLVMEPRTGSVTTPISPEDERAHFPTYLTYTSRPSERYVGSVTTPISPEDERAHFPTYLSDGRLVYVSEHITLDQSWTDLWAQPPLEGSARVPVVSGVQAQGPFELSRDGQQLLFASPRSGVFEIYGVTLDEAGKAALAEKVVRGSGGTQASLTPAAAAVAAKQDSGPLGESTPYVLGLVAVGLVGLGIEFLVRARRRAP